MPVTASNAIQREWLQAVAKRVAEGLQPGTIHSRLTVFPKRSIVPHASTSDGWVVEIGSVRGDRGSALQLWLDRWPRTHDRKLYVCYRSTRAEQVLRVAKAAAAVIGPFDKLGDASWEIDAQSKVVRLRAPLARSLYGKPLAELHFKYRPWSFYGLYFLRVPEFRHRPPDALIARCADFLQATARSVIGLLEEATAADQEYSAIENRRRVGEHKRRERSARLARIAKTRDGFTCRVCKFNFEVTYGALGEGFAEAHHTLALSKLRESVETSPRDLVTVCANCHRMLHRMKGASTDVALLRRLVSRYQRAH